MKKLMALILALPLCVFAADKPRTVTVTDATGQKMVGTFADYKPGLSFDVFGSGRTYDLNKLRGGAGLGVNYFFANSLGVGIEGITENTARKFLDTAQGNVLWRITSGRAALNLSAGAGYNFESDEYFASLGGGPEYAVTEYLHGFFDARAVKPIEGGDIHALFRLGVRLSF